MPLLRNFVVATPNRAPHHIHAGAAERNDRLRLHLYAGRQTWGGVDPERIRHHTLIGAASAAAMRFLPRSLNEAARFGLSPWFDRWVLPQLQEGDRLITSYGYAVRSMRAASRNGGLAILDAGNSHPENLWSIVSEEHKRWGVSAPPLPTGHHHRSVESANQCDFVIGLSNFVTKSFMERGLPAERTFVLPRPADLQKFHPAEVQRPVNRPFTLVCTGGVSFRKGSPYLFEALRIIRKQVPNVRLLQSRLVAPEMEKQLESISDLPITWVPYLSKAALADHLRQADLFVLPSLEDGLARTATDAMACGLPVIVSENTGAADLVIPGQTGDVVPIRDARAIADRALEWWEKIRTGGQIDVTEVRKRLSPEHFAQRWVELLAKLEATSAR